jgi:hypothetical protein
MKIRFLGILVFLAGLVLVSLSLQADSKASAYNISGIKLTPASLLAAKFTPHAVPEEEESTPKEEINKGYLQFREYFNEPWRISGQTIPLMRRRSLGLFLVILGLFFLLYRIKHPHTKTHEN